MNRVFNVLSNSARNTVSNVVCVIGSLRSGADAVTQRLGEMGWRTPDSSLDFRRANQALLRSLRGNHVRPPLQLRLPETGLAGFAELLEACRGSEHLLLSDPVASLTLGYWREQLKVDRVVLCVGRVDSARKHTPEGLAHDHAQQLWADYLVSGLLAARGLPLMVHLAPTPPAESSARLAAFLKSGEWSPSLGARWPVEGPEWIREFYLALTGRSRERAEQLAAKLLPRILKGRLAMGVPGVRMSPDPRGPLLSVHLPKTAGSSFAHLLLRLFRRGLELSYESHFEKKAGARCVHGHVGLPRFAPGLSRWPSPDLGPRSRAKGSLPLSSRPETGRGPGYRSGGVCRQQLSSLLPLPEDGRPFGVQFCGRDRTVRTEHGALPSSIRGSVAPGSSRPQRRILIPEKRGAAIRSAPSSRNGLKTSIRRTTPSMRAGCGGSRNSAATTTFSL